MYHNTTRKRENRRQATRNIISSDIEDFPIIKKHREFIMWDENVGRYILSGKDSVTSADLAALKTEILGDTNIQQNLDTLKRNC